MAGNSASRRAVQLADGRKWCGEVGDILMRQVAIALLIAASCFGQGKQNVVQTRKDYRLA